jgi:hypothetical protein
MGLDLVVGAGDAEHKVVRKLGRWAESAKHSNAPTSYRFKVPDSMFNAQLFYPNERSMGTFFGIKLLAGLTLSK